jgi:hypothetical protein
MQATAIKTLVAREYLRVSVDKSGRERSQDEQHAETGAQPTVRDGCSGPPTATPARPVASPPKAATASTG